MLNLRHDWSIQEIEDIYTAPLTDLVFRAAEVHRAHHLADEVQGCMLLSIKTGGCPEDCAYCPQSARYDTEVGREDLMQVDETLAAARSARDQGATRFCMGAAWRDVPTDARFDRVLEMVKGVRELGMEACCTLGMLNEKQAEALAGAGLSAYNHNLDTSPEFYGEIITTRNYQERLDTLARVRKAGISVCSGGIIGMGESDDDIIDLALSLRAMDIDSIPVNFLTSIDNTPFENKHELTPQRCLKTLCLFRFVNPSKEIRVAGGREINLRSLQPLALYPANSIFVNGYLTTPGQEASDAHQMIRDLGFELDQPAAI